MKSALFKNNYDKRSSWINMHNCNCICVERGSIVVRFTDNTTYLAVSSDYLDEAKISSKEVLEAIVDKLWGSSDDSIIDVDEIIEKLQKGSK